MKRNFYVEQPNITPVDPAAKVTLSNVVPLSNSKWRMRAISEYIRRVYGSNPDFAHDRRMDSNGFPHLVFANFTISYRGFYPECALEIHNRRFSVKIAISRKNGKKFNVGDICDRLVRTIRSYPKTFGVCPYLFDVPEVHDQRY